ncbi:hypothetical protein [Taibaiella koreensis]|uniref:hypothetical protein n=1 Tax=Taibaiella koreensis TaxID=1268548 RepID=UPI000E59AC5C|nr:hypothetical protein [Taibaiella koreensis]
MKRLIILLALSSFAQLTWGQTRSGKQANHKAGLIQLNGGAVSEHAQQQFASDFQNTSGIGWKRETFYDRVHFTNANGSTMDAYYDIEGKLIGTTAAASFNEIPPAAQKEISKRYPNCSNAPVLFFDDNNDNDTDMFLYGSTFDDADAYFVQVRDKKGKLEILKVDPSGKVYRFPGKQS